MTLYEVISSLLVALFVWTTFHQGGKTREADRRLSTSRGEGAESERRLLDLRSRVSRYLARRTHVETMRRAVFIVGPKDSGKTQLVRSWLRPERAPTKSLGFNKYECVAGRSEPRRHSIEHFGEFDIKSMIRTQYVFDVYDHPGEDEHKVPFYSALDGVLGPRSVVLVISPFAEDVQNKTAELDTSLQRASEYFDNTFLQVLHRLSEGRSTQVALLVNKIDRLQDGDETGRRDLTGAVEKFCTRIEMHFGYRPLTLWGSALEGTQLPQLRAHLRRGLFSDLARAE